jgi:hypothetical protein
MNNDKYLEYTGLILSLVALLVSVIALVYTIITYLLKSGHKIRYSYSVGNNRQSNDAYVPSLTIENLKDRATVIFDIYLQLGANNFLLIESFEKSPLILQPFAVYQKEYDPVMLYSDGTHQILIDDLLMSRKVSKQLVLSTTDGKIIAHINKKRWNPLSVFFRNYFTSIIQPQRMEYRGKSYGSNVRFLVVFHDKNAPDVVLTFQPGDEQIRHFEKFQLTKQSLESKEALEAFLEEKRTQGLLTCEKIEVLAFGQKAKKMMDEFSPASDAIAIARWRYLIQGWWFTRRENRKTNKMNNGKK